MNIQIYGTKKNFDSKKAERYFKERSVKFQFIEIHEFGIAKKTFEMAKRCIDLQDMVDKKSKAYEKLFIAYIDESKIEETLLENPQLFSVPIVRNGNDFTLGYKPEVWKNWE